MIKTGQKDIQGIIIAVTLICLGSAALWNTTSMLDSDSYIFPRVIVLVMIFLCTTFIVWQATLSANKQKDDTSSNEVFSLRGLVLVLAMLIGALLMPFIGFIASSLIIFFVVVGCAMYNTWTRKRQIVYPMVGTFIILVAYFVFVKLLLVPLPSGSLFEQGLV